MSFMQRHALDYAARGWKLIPIWWIDQATGTCGCGNPYCSAPGKHPLVGTGRGLEGASSDPSVVGGWWDRWPQANIAAACGLMSGVVVVDLDLDDDTDGENEFRGWIAAQGIDVPETLIAETGSGGRHYVYRHPGEPAIKNATRWLPGCDLKADGGYVLLAPSGHVSGGAYRWLNELPLAELGALEPHLRAARGAVGSRGGEPGDQPEYSYRDAVRDGPRMGTRDHFFNCRAFELRRQDVPWADAERDVRRLWERTEQQPGNEFPWEAALAKLTRVWETVEPDPLPHWNPWEQAGDETLAMSGPTDEKLTDTGNAARLVRLHGDEVRFSSALGWMVWDGRIWAPDEKERSIELMKDTARRMFLEASVLTADEREAMLGWARQSESRARIESALRLARTDPKVAVVPDELDQHPLVLVCENGTIDLRTGELGDFARDLLLTKRSPVTYRPDASSGLWDEYLKSVTGGDDELQDYLRRAAGYTLTGITAEEVFFLVYGPKGSGKSTFVDALQTILGPLALAVGEDVLTHMRGKSTPLDALADMFGRRLVCSTELPEGGRLSESTIKRMTGGDRIRGRHLYRSAFEYRPTYKLWIATNYAPQVRDDAMWRRIRRVPFPREVPKEERDWRIKAQALQPRSELAEAVLAWAVRGCLEWQRDGLGSAQQIEIDTAEYHEEQDRFGQFIDEECEVGSRLEAPVRDLYSRYRVWSDTVGEARPMSQQAFSLKLKERGFKQNKSVRPVRYEGVALKAVGIYGV